MKKQLIISLSFAYLLGLNINPVKAGEAIYCDDTTFAPANIQIDQSIGEMTITHPIEQTTNCSSVEFDDTADMQSGPLPPKTSIPETPPPDKGQGGQNPLPPQSPDPNGGGGSGGTPNPPPNSNDPNGSQGGNQGTDPKLPPNSPQPDPNTGGSGGGTSEEESCKTNNLVANPGTLSAASACAPSWWQKIFKPKPDPNGTKQEPPQIASNPAKTNKHLDEKLCDELELTGTLREDCKKAVAHWRATSETSHFLEAISRKLAQQYGEIVGNRYAVYVINHMISSKLLNIDYTKVLKIATALEDPLVKALERKGIEAVMTHMSVQQNDSGQPYLFLSSSGTVMDFNPMVWESFRNVPDLDLTPFSGAKVTLYMMADVNVTPQQLLQAIKDNDITNLFTLDKISGFIMLEVTQNGRRTEIADACRFQFGQIKCKNLN